MDNENTDNKNNQLIDSNLTNSDSNAEFDIRNLMNYDLIRRSNISYYDTYYSLNTNNLGLIYDDKGFRRNKSLTECFQSKWWKTTQKNNYEWTRTHLLINLIKKIRIWKFPCNHFPGWIFESFDDFINNYWTNPTISEIKEIFKLIGIL